ncbi:hypothetical protein ACFPYN_11215 [Paenisporosarcina macmurdoensis]|uniref:DUF1878 family protein n=1 Tax=Paenisporosarcina macmurdoensis TaxID=212659 RepID=A0ABW1L8X1_9BACL
MENDKFEDIESKIALITYCISELHEIINTEYKSRAYELLMNGFNSREIELIDQYFSECLRNQVAPSFNDFRETVIRITNNQPFTIGSAEKLLLAYKHENLFINVVNKILKNK